MEAQEDTERGDRGQRRIGNERAAQANERSRDQAGDPGSTWYTASVLRKDSSELQPSSSTHSRLIIAICAAGPPQASVPNFRKRMKI